MASGEVPQNCEDIFFNYCIKCAIEILNKIFDIQWIDHCYICQIDKFTEFFTCAFVLKSSEVMKFQFHFI